MLGEIDGIKLVLGLCDVVGFIVVAFLVPCFSFLLCITLCKIEGIKLVLGLCDSVGCVAFVSGSEEGVKG
jgi:hypothetical protein